MENTSINLHQFQSVKYSSEYLFKDRGSKFIGFVFPIQSEDDFKQKLNEIKETHPGCNHHCYAFRLGIHGDVYRYSDDGEPNNSAGKPIYGQLLSTEITNVGAVVARYFGGTKLGVGGLIHAYKEATRLAIEENEICITELKSEYIIHYEYDKTSLINQIFAKFSIEIIDSKFELKCSSKVRCVLSLSAEFESQCKENNLELIAV